MGNNVHRLKLVQPYFDEVVSGDKTFEVRVNDRDYKVDDILELLEYDPETTWLTDRSVRVRVTYILDNPQYVLPSTVIMAIEPVDGATCMTDKQGIAGRITVDFTIWCGLCSKWESDSFSSNGARSSELFRQNGWHKTNKHGWICKNHKKKGEEWT